LKESDDNIFIPRGSKEEKDKVLTKKDYDKIQEYIKNGSEGRLMLTGSLIRFLPKNLTRVGGNFYLLFSQIEKLPDNLTVNGHLWLDGCKNLQRLPNGLVVNYNLDIPGTNITSLPSDLEVGGDLTLYRTPIANMYTEKQIREMVPGVKGRIRS